MTFAEPWLLLGLLAVPLIVIAYLLVQRRRSRYVVRFTNVDLLANLVAASPAKTQRSGPASSQSRKNSSSVAWALASLRRRVENGCVAASSSRPVVQAIGSITPSTTNARTLSGNRLA